MSGSEDNTKLIPKENTDRIWKLITITKEQNMEIGSEEI